MDHPKSAQYKEAVEIMRRSRYPVIENLKLISELFDVPYPEVCRDVFGKEAK
jgi:hypothetical protein